jgi:hypothetical protein
VKGEIMLRKLEGIFFGDLDGKRVIIIDPNEADPDVAQIIDEMIRERRRNDERRRTIQRSDSILVRKESEADLQV